MRYLLLFLFSTSLFSESVIEVIPTDLGSFIRKQVPDRDDELHMHHGDLWIRLKKLCLAEGIQLKNADFVKVSEYKSSPIYLLKNAYGNIQKFLFNNYPFSLYTGELDSIPSEKKVLILWEPPSVLPYQFYYRVLNKFSAVLTWDDDMVDNVHFFKLHFPSLLPLQDGLVPFKNRKLCCMILSNKFFGDIQGELFTERREIVDFFESKPSEMFDLYGMGWDSFKNNKGPTRKKHEVLKNYRFNICLENFTGAKGWLTEKIFDSLACGSIPIYHGATNIADLIPSTCFIDLRQFRSYDEMLDFMKNFSEELYEKYLENIKQFLESKEAQVYTTDAVSKKIFELITK